MVVLLFPIVGLLLWGVVFGAIWLNKFVDALFKPKPPLAPPP